MRQVAGELLKLLALARAQEVVDMHHNEDGLLGVEVHGRLVDALLVAQALESSLHMLSPDLWSITGTVHGLLQLPHHRSVTISRVRVRELDVHVAAHVPVQKGTLDVHHHDLVALIDHGVG